MKQRKAVNVMTIALGLALVVAACQTSPPGRSVETMEILSFNTQWNYTLLNLIRSNQVEKVQKMLEMRTFLGLQEVWEAAGETGVATNRVCNQTFREIYPGIRQQIPLSRFQPFPLSQRQSLTNFVKFADRKFLDK